MFDSALSLGLIALVFLAAGFSKGLIGLGLSIPAEAALPLRPSFVTNLVRIAPARAAWQLTRRLWLVLPGVVPGTATTGVFVPPALSWLQTSLPASQSRPGGRHMRHG